MHRFAVNGHYPVSGGWVIGGGVESHQPERLFLVVGEQGLVHGLVLVLVGQPGGVELVEVISAGALDSPPRASARAAAVSGIDPVLPEDIPYRPLPGRLFDVWAATPVTPVSAMAISRTSLQSEVPPACT